MKVTGKSPMTKAYEAQRADEQKLNVPKRHTVFDAIDETLANLGIAEERVTELARRLIGTWVEPECGADDMCSGGMLDALSSSAREMNRRIARINDAVDQIERALP
jgi:hypothetical protein